MTAPPARESPPRANAFRSGRAHNPFASRSVAPGRTAYLFPEGGSLEALADELEAVGWTGELIGPHGAGKSTLLFCLADEARRRGKRLAFWRCREDAVRLPWNWRWLLRGADVCFLEGGEVVPKGQMRALKRACSRRGIGLLATTHEPLGLGWSREVRPSAREFARLVRALAPEEPGAQSFGEPEARRLLAAHGGSARDALDALYDACEDGRPLDRLEG
jgi:hypothetical protein